MGNKMSNDRDKALDMALAGASESEPSDPPERVGGPEGWTIGGLIFADGTGMVHAGADAAGTWRLVKLYKGAHGHAARKSMQRERAIIDAAGHAGIPRVGCPARGGRPQFRCHPAGATCR